ncbi:conserved protein of unknown function [Candidatus Promineifilum breve]|uniref:BrnT family toxin n=1 Tax=Candidatus Promineifilum breve TaxID=1806508 RepID=A0A160T6E5_9CHLR|nr:BrnT family toxin [Candidatus Promineifilum breve]CUS05926.1 conserved protein of unknown function [Candidatus Promineifilum breve]
MSYEWDPVKAEINLFKHDVDFADAVAVFEDEQVLWRDDVGDWEEERFVAVGMDHLSRVLIVVFTFRSEVVRIISARLATKQERATYEQSR